MRGKLLLTIFCITILFALLTSPASALYKEGQDSKGTYSVTDKKHYPIIFIPGVAGSELWYDEHNAWPGWLGQRVTGGYFDNLVMNNRGNSEFDITARRSIRYGLEAEIGDTTYNLAPESLVGVYAGFFEYMESEGYTVKQNRSSGFILYDFAYDWRQDNHKTAYLLEKYIQKVKKETKSDKVIIFAHSMGGVVARLYLKEAKNAQNVAGVVFMGTPHQGSPKPFLAFTQGYNFGNAKLSNEKMWEIMSNWQAGYQLMPEEIFIMDFQGEDWPMKEIIGTGWISKLEYQYYKEDPENWKVRYGLPNRKYAKDIPKFQSKHLGDSLDEYPWIQYYMIEGVNQTTTYGFLYELVKVPEFDVPVLHLTELTDDQGDGTVPAKGAAVKGLTKRFEVQRDHGGIPSDPQTWPILTDLRKQINNETQRNIQVSKLSGYTGVQLLKVHAWPDSGTIFAAIKKGFLGFLKLNEDDKERLSMREELRGKAKSMLKLARVNIYVGEKENQDTFYAVIQEYKIHDIGTGEIKPNTAKIYTDWETFSKVTAGDVELFDAIVDGKVKIKGIGIVEEFLLQAYTFISRFGFDNN